MKYNLSYMIVYEDWENYDWYFEKKFPCKADEYEIFVQMSGNLLSGTGDKVEIRGYDWNGKTTEWREVTTPVHDGFERLSKYVSWILENSLSKDIWTRLAFENLVLIVWW